MAKILLVEDEESIRGFIKINLIRNGFEVIEAGSGEEGIRKALNEKPDMAILDVMLPGIDGFQVCSKLRNEYPKIGIIMLTAKGQDMDKIMGLEYGADDYIVKPFNPLEVVLRVKAILRRIEIEDDKINKDENKITSGPFVIDLYSQKLLKNGIEIDVTPKEYMLMKLFIENPNKAFTRDELLNLIWGYDFFGDDRTIDTHIKMLRNNLGEYRYLIKTIRGIGYKFSDEKE